MDCPNAFPKKVALSRIRESRITHLTDVSKLFSDIPSSPLGSMLQRSNVMRPRVTPHMQSSSREASLYSLLPQLICAQQTKPKKTMPIFTQVLELQSIINFMKFARKIGTVPVVVVGGGPVGLYSALLLKQKGIPFKLFQRTPSPGTHPKAHYLSPRTLQLFSQVPGLVDQIYHNAQSLQHFKNYDVASHAAGGVLHHSRKHFLPSVNQRLQALSAVSFERPVHLPQHILHRLLWNRLRVGQDITVAEVSSHKYQNGRVQLFDSGGLKVAQSNIVLACDGYSSKLRKSIGVGVKGSPSLMKFVNIHFSSPSLLGKMMGEGRTPMLTFVFNSKLIATLVSHRIETAEFVLQVPNFPPHFDYSLADPASILKALVQSHSDVAFKVHQRNGWTLSGVIAQQYCKDNVMLCGDAAHSFPPAGGFGLNTGIADAHNLVHKLSQHGLSQQISQIGKLYEAERQSQAKKILQETIRLYGRSLNIGSYLGADYELLMKCERVLPSALTRAVVEHGPKILLLNKLRNAESVGLQLEKQQYHIPMLFEDMDFRFRYEAGDFDQRDSRAGRLVGCPLERKQLSGSGGRTVVEGLKYEVRGDGVIKRRLGDKQQ